ncbi:MAG: septum site-determining protein, partial [Cyanobacteria bacterium J06639_14]
LLLNRRTNERAIVGPNDRSPLQSTVANNETPNSQSAIPPGALTPSQVRQILNQVLQTLESLHGQKYMLPGGQLQTGLVHGNLNLDSLVMLPDANSYYEKPQLLTFLRDLALWEFLFMPPPLSKPIPQVTDDLSALGRIGFYALVGRWTDSYGRRLKPHNSQIWPGSDLPLEQYLRQLLGLENPTFADAATARQALLRLPTPRHVSTSPRPHALSPSSSPPSPRRLPLWFWLLLLGGLGLLGALLFGWWWSRRQAIASSPPPLCCITDVSAVPPGQFTYAAERQGTWYPLWHSKNLVAQDQTLEQVLESQQPDLNLQLLPVPTRQDAITHVLQDAAAFAIAPLTASRPPDLMAEPIAYDGLVAFVAFSYVERDRGLPQHLQGQLSLSQLRQLYTGEILNWEELGGPDLPVKLYLPAQPELIQVFEERVLQTPEAIATFRRQWHLEESDPLSSSLGFTTPPDPDAINGETLPILAMLRSILQDFERQPQVGSLGFASLSQIYGQCSVYPLAIAADNAPTVQPLYQKDDTPISPALDLCEDKGNYGPKQTLFVNQTYPLAYPLTVFYRLDNSRVAIGPLFVQMMTTDEGQQMLSKTGLVPLRALP